MDKTTRVIISLAVLGGLWYWFGKGDKAATAAHTQDYGPPSPQQRLDAGEVLNYGPDPSQILDAGGVLDYGPFQSSAAGTGNV